MKKITPKSLENAALYYLKRYSATQASLTRVLQRKTQRALYKKEAIAELPAWIESTVQKCLSLGYVNDEQFAHAKKASLTRAGKSERVIKQKLSLKGVSKDQLKCLSFSEDDEMAGALKLIKKKKPENTFESKRKTYEVLARAGFSSTLIQKALQIYFTVPT
jgi:regulatory protein